MKTASRALAFFTLLAFAPSLALAQASGGGEKKGGGKGKYGVAATKVMVGFILKEMAKGEIPFCWRDTYTRGWGYPWKFGDTAFSLTDAYNRCASDHKYDGGCEKSGALIYPNCKGDYYGNAHVCWQHCPKSQPYECGPAACATDGSSCASGVINMVIAPLEIALNIAMAVGTGGTANATKAAVTTSLKTGARLVAKQTLMQGIKTMAKSIITKVQKKVAEKLTKKFAKETAQGFMEAAAESLAGSALAQDFDIKSFLMDLDPTGIAAVVDAFNKPICEPDQEAPQVYTDEELANAQKNISAAVSALGKWFSQTGSSTSAAIGQVIKPQPSSTSALSENVDVVSAVRTSGHPDSGYNESQTACDARCYGNSECIAWVYEPVAKLCFTLKSYNGTTSRANRVLGVKKQNTQQSDKWRTDGRCGASNPAPNGQAGECNPSSASPCCSSSGWCGDTSDHCSCGSGCRDFRGPASQPAQSAPAAKWRTDGRCGSSYPAPNGQAGECNPSSAGPCCSSGGWCGNTPAHCGGSQPAQPASTKGAFTALGKCLDVDGGNRANGTRVQIWDCVSGHANQQWEHNSAGQLVWVGTGKCLDVDSGRTADGTKLQIWDCISGNANQVWSRSGNTFVFKGSKCLDVYGGRTANGTPVHLWSCGSNNPAQTWTSR
jgi:hypothetical protein